MMAEHWSRPERCIWEIVCGLPESRAKEQRILILKAYFDDSGKHDQSPVQVVAGYIASAESWAKFSNKWQGILDSFGLKNFHMSDAWRMSRDYQQLSPLQRNMLIIKLVDCIGSHVERAFVSSVDLDVFYGLFPKEYSSKLQSLRPYTLNFYTLMTMVYRFAFERHFQDQIEVVFEEQGGESEMKILSGMYEFRKLVEENFEQMLVTSPVFRSDKNMHPLQAADMLAWLVRRDALNASKGDERYASLPKSESIILTEAILTEALSMPHEIKIWDHSNLPSAGKDILARYDAISQGDL